MAARLCQILFALACLAAARSGSADDVFRDKVALIFQRRCLSCHNASDKKGGLSIETAASVEAGGDSGSPVAAGKPDESYLLDLIAPENGRAKMPKDADPLKPEEIVAIRQWIIAGATWPKDFKLEPARVASTDWWSLRPLVKPAIPKSDDAWIRTPIDSFILAKQRELGLAHAPEADRRTLIRRLYFDLIGLPPTPEEIEAFLDDRDERAYEKLVDHLLESPNYGERWARHWLDVVHYGETHGYDKDKPRLSSWPYRDYVIRSFNADKPYTRFLQEQIAGDALFPGTHDGIEALGFIAAGPWDFIGHAEVPESKIDGKVARHLDRDDMITNTIQTFNSLTVQCAQCHNHKFDPILQEDYYQLQAVFAAIDRTEKPYDLDPSTAQRRAELAVRQKSLQQQRSELDKRIAERGGAKLKDLDSRIAELEKLARPGAFPPEYGYHSGIEARQDAVKWVQVDLKATIKLSKIVLRPCHDDFNNIGDGFGFPVRFKVELCDEPEFKSSLTVLDSTAADVANPKLFPTAIALESKSARYIRLTATRLAPRMNDFILAMSELEAYDADGKNLARGGAVTSLDSIEAPSRWSRQNLIDGLYAGGGSTALEELTQVRKQRSELIEASTSAADHKALTDLSAAEAEVAKSLRTLPPQQVCYIGAVHTGSGTFEGTGARGGKPRPIFILNRGNVMQPGKEVGPGALSAIPGLSAAFDLPPDHSEGDRRAALAKWLSDPRNPLTWRSIVNRVWQYHFGRGLVDSANDFGRNGRLPSHPELLDYLAVEFRDDRQSLKDLHRLVVTSATYRQVSGEIGDQGLGTRQNIEADAENRYLWRMNRRKVEAELVRDSVLLLAGKLDRTMYGPSFQDFVIEKPEHSPHYEYLLHDPEDPKSHRRSVYRFLVRSQPQPFMATLDCADPSMQVDKRNESLSALQSLALLNNAFMVTMSQHFAQRIDKTPGDLADKVERAYYEALGRKPAAADRAALTLYAEQHGLANLCRVLVNLNEFVFVD
jgi:mono/diheme cytochrome c family protein